MSRWLKIAEVIDRLNDRVGRFASWLVLAVVLLGAWNALARYATRFTAVNLSSNAYLELQWYLFSAVFLLGAAYTLKRDEHVRVDVLHAGLHPIARAWVDVVGTILFLIPFCVFVLWSSWFPVRNSWMIFEQSPDPGGLARYPVKTLIPVAFLLLLLQAVATLIKRVAFLREHRAGAGEASS
ncbi:MAG TPA: TRAP transporter small permease subunit [Kiritimatiellia bacterium]|nr:TRAP transporter small permease subunit [Kiritimatiellia bacterium]HMO99960.1 TRAP transporter small permease subunit [Kiritimatiellia bacterium]HMP97030.1 TRAP transporter small permease subunit [Kiritimatiellia bacterium]